MIKRIFVAGLITLVVVSCGKHNTKVEADFASYLISFRELYKVDGEVSIEFEDIKLPVIGLCYSSGRVTVDRKWWANASDTRRKIMIYHELGHCLLGREHDDEVIGSCPKSIMNKLLLSEYCFNISPSWYLTELGQSRTRKLIPCKHQR